MRPIAPSFTTPTSQFLTHVYVLQAVAAEIEQLQVFGHQELPGLQMSDAVPRQVHLDDVNRQPGRNVVQICGKQTGRQNTRHRFCKGEMMTPQKNCP